MCLVFSSDKLSVGRDSSVGIKTRYGLGGSEIESRWGRDFPPPSRPALGPTQPPTQYVPGLSRGKAVETWRWPPIPYCTEVKGRVELYIYSPSGPSWTVARWSLSLKLCSVVQSYIVVCWAATPLLDEGISNKPRIPLLPTLHTTILRKNGY
jgi:hypothetical protein